MRLANFSIDQLKELPLRAMVAFAARCARRVEPLAQLPEGSPQAESRRQAVDAAIRMAEVFARGTDTPPDESVLAAINASRDAGGERACAAALDAAAQAAHAAASVWHIASDVPGEGANAGKLSARTGMSLGASTHVTADIAALNAYTAAAEAFLSVGYHNEYFVSAALGDYDKLVRLKLGHYPEPGAPIDPSPGGPLGPL
jgi:hypothetical protein